VVVTEPLLNECCAAVWDSFCDACMPVLCVVQIHHQSQVLIPLLQLPCFARQACPSGRSVGCSVGSAVGSLWGLLWGVLWGVCGVCCGVSCVVGSAVRCSVWWGLLWGVLCGGVYCGESVGSAVGCFVGSSSLGSVGSWGQHLVDQHSCL
jgi:hypothetical protein